MIQNYTTAEEYAADESFQEYVLRRAPKHVAQWEDFLKSNPDKHSIIEEAKFYVMLFSTSEGLAEPINAKDEKIANHKRRESGINWKWRLKIASVFLLLICACGGMYHIASSHPDYQMITQIAEDQNASIFLSDLSTIDLRSGGKAKFLESWESSDEREVWLEGEAYFDVKKTGADQKPFLVHTPLGTVSVLGTKFIVRSDASASRVILEEGSVHFLADGKTYEMVPGDVLTKEKNDVKISQGVIARSYDSWRNGKLGFESKSLNEIISTLNNSYDLNIRLDNDKLGKKKITAKVRKNDPQMLLKAISEIYSIKIIHQGNGIILK